MAVTKIGLNFSKLNNLTFPEFNASVRASDILKAAPTIANQSTKYYFGWGVIIAMFVTLYSTISDNIGQSGFGYDETRAFGITSGITLIFGLLLVMVGYIHNFKPIGIMAVLFLLAGILFAYLENKN